MNNIVSKKMIIVKRDWFIVRNVCIVIYKYIGKITKQNNFK